MDSVAIHVDTTFKAEHFSFLANALKDKETYSSPGQHDETANVPGGYPVMTLSGLPVTAGFTVPEQQEVLGKGQTNNKNYSDHLPSTYYILGTSEPHLFLQPPNKETEAQTFI